MCGIQVIERVAIGRASQPFPHSKRSRHVSAHSAFPLGLSTPEGRIRLERRRGAPASEGHHLPSSLHPLTSLLPGLPWRTFTVSQLLPPGVWLLRRLRPPRRTLAYARPTLVGTHREHGVPQFHHKRRPSNPQLPALRRADQGQPRREARPRLAPAFPFWARCVSHLHLSSLTTLPQVP